MPSSYVTIIVSSAEAQNLTVAAAVDPALAAAEEKDAASGGVQADLASIFAQAAVAKKRNKENQPTGPKVITGQERAQVVSSR